MPTFDTGNAQWDQGLSSLANALFPDPSKAAQGYAYGSAARKAQLESNQIIAKQNAGNRFLMMPFAAAGQGPEPAPPTFYQPQNVPSAAPILAPPSNLPMSTPSGQPLSSAIVGPSGGQPLPPSTMTPAQVTSQLGNMLDNHPNSPTNGGTAPAVSPPVPGAAPASNATTSDGRVPQNDLASSVIQPGSVTDPNGGPKFAPPAAHNGSPSRPAVNLGTYIATGTAAGYDAAQLAANGQAVLAQAVAEGRLTPQQYYDQLAGVGQAGPLNATIGANATTGAAQISANASMANQRMATGETRYEFENAPVWVKPNDTAPAIMMSRKNAIAMGLPITDSSLETTRQGQTGAPLLVTPPGSPLGTPPVSATAGQAQTGPLASRPNVYQPGTADIAQTQGGAYDLFLDQSGKLVKAKVGESQAQHLTPVQAGTDAANAAFIAQIRNETDPQKQQRLIDTYNSTPVTPKVVDATENAKNQFLIDKQLQLLMPVPTGASWNPQQGTNLNPAGASPELGRTLSDLSDQYFLSGPPGIKGNRIQATNEALKQLITQQYVYPNQDRGTNWFSNADSSVNKPVFDKQGNALPPAPHFQVHIYKPGTNQAYAPGQAPRVMMQPSLSSAIPPATTAQPAGALPPGAITAAPGAAEGSTGTIQQTGQRYVVRGGFAYPMQ